jgi:hypothetical protein
MQVTNCKKNSFKGKKNVVSLNCFLRLFCIEIWLQRKIFYRFPTIYSYELNAATVQIPKETEILYFSFKVPMNQKRRLGWVKKRETFEYTHPSVSWLDEKKIWQDPFGNDGRSDILCMRAIQSSHGLETIVQDKIYGSSLTDTHCASPGLSLPGHIHENDYITTTNINGKGLLLRYTLSKSS